MSAFVTRARALVGCRFRPQGRVPELGLDCIGLACAVYRISADEVPGDYRLRSRDSGRLQAELERFFRLVATAEAKAGDLVLHSVAPDQLHLAVLSDRGFGHADASLRKIVETPGAAPWPILSVHRPRRKTFEE